MHPKWKLGAGVAMLALGVWLVPAALSGFTAETSFTTSEPIAGGGSSGGVVEGFTVSDAGFGQIEQDEEDELGSTSLSDYRLNINGTLQSVGGLGNSVSSYSGDYSLTYQGETVSAGQFDAEATASLGGNDVLLNALLSESTGAPEGFDGLSSEDGSFSLTGLSADGSSFSGSFNAGGGISSDPLGSGNGELDLSSLDCLDLLGELCGCDACQLEGGSHSDDDSNGVTAVPEPTSFAALGLASLAVMGYRGRSSRRR